MTDNEIIEALECCIDCKCKECPCYKNIEGEMRCTEIDEEEILDLINQQKAEIERLQKENEFHLKTITENAQRALELLVDEIDKAKTEAIKEFAERLKAEYADFDELHEEIRYDNLILSIDDLVKEMTENIIKVEHGSLCETETYKGGE